MQGNKAVVIFLIKFFGTYAVLFIAYSLYLQATQKTTDVFSCAPITQVVAEQSSKLVRFFGYSSEIEQDIDELSIKLYVEDVFVAKIIEGCNAISIIILFSSFIVAFSGKFKQTLLYVLGGSLLIYGINILRIAFIAIALFNYPHYQKVLHDIVFPSIIYGSTFLLWFIWVKKIADT